jgi:hypothetical protein
MDDIADDDDDGLRLWPLPVLQLRWMDRDYALVASDRADNNVVYRPSHLSNKSSHLHYHTTTCVLPEM